MNYLDVALEWHSHGFNVIPIRDGDKHPAVASWKEWQVNGQTEEWIRHVFAKDYYAIALVCGYNNVEVIDVDLKADPDGTIVKDLIAELKAAPYNLIKDYAYQTTPSGGCHLIYRSEGKPPGNHPIAMKDNKAIIETRGSGGYALIAPSPGYTMYRKEVVFDSKILNDERIFLMDLCESFNVDPPIGFKEATSRGLKTGVVDPDDDRPGTAFNKTHGRDEVLAMLESHGWKVAFDRGHQVHMIRPGKEKGISGNWHDEVGKFYCFTSSAYPLQAGVAYSPFALLVALQYDGDWSAAARDLAPDKAAGSVSQAPMPVEKRVDVNADKWAGRVWVYDPYEDDGNDVEDTILQYVAQKDVYSVLGPGGGLSLGGEMKARKSMLIRTIAGAAVAKKAWLGFQWTISPRKILIFDTEQSKKWLKKGGRQLTTMLGTKEWADVIELHYIRELSSKERLDFIEEVLYLARAKGKVDMVVIDGIVDLVTNFNDVEQSYKVHERLTAMQKDSAFAGIVHLNRGKDSTWERGHLGAIWTQKAETIIRVTYDDNSKISTAQCYRSRDMPFPEFEFMQDKNGLVIPANSFVPSELAQGL